MWEILKDIILYVPRKIYYHFENMRILEVELQKEKAIRREYEKRLNAIKYNVERNGYNHEEIQKRKIIELATTTITANSK